MVRRKDPFSSAELVGPPEEHGIAERTVIGMGQEAAERRPRGQAGEGREPDEAVHHQRGDKEGDQGEDGADAGPAGGVRTVAPAHDRDSIPRSS